jgi:putative hydrolase of the HAD superfamily
MRDIPEYKGSMANWPRVELMPYVEESLKLFHNEYTCCAASNAGDSDAELMSRAFERAGIKKYLKYFMTSRELGYKKPDIKFYSEIIHRVGLSPEMCVMVGNDYKKDIEPAKLTGMHTVLISSESDNLELQHADFIISSMKELNNVLDSIWK